VTALVVVTIATLLPYTPLRSILGFTPMPIAFLLFLVIATVTYLLLVELVKRKLMPRLLTQSFGLE
jgi:Mg2+-importing ATPase